MKKKIFNRKTVIFSLFILTVAISTYSMLKYQNKLDGYYVATPAATATPKPKVTSLSANLTTVYPTTSKSVPVSVKAYSGSSYINVSWSVSGSNASHSCGTQSICSVTIKSLGCDKTNTVTVTATDSTGHKESINIDVKSYGDWSSGVEGDWTPIQHYNKTQMLTREGCDAYDDYDSAKNVYTKRYNRCCQTINPSYNYCCVREDEYVWKGNVSSPNLCASGFTKSTTIGREAACKTPPGCYENSAGIKKWTDDRTYGKWLKNVSQANCKNCYADSNEAKSITKTSFQKSTSTPYFWRDVSVEGCKAPNLYTYCSPTIVNPAKKNYSATACEDPLELTFKDGEKCEGTSFYDISCTNDVKFNFDNGDDAGKKSIGPVNTIYAGEGVGFGVTMEIAKTCKADFKEGNWKTAYDIVKKDYDDEVNYLKKTLSENERILAESRKYWALSQINDLKKYSNDYREHEYTTEFEKELEFDLKYKANGVQKESRVTFVKESEEEGTPKTTDVTTVNLGVDGLTNPTNFTWTNTSKAKYILPKVYLDAVSGAISATGSIDGGNKVYVDYYADTGEYPINLTYISHQGVTKDGLITVNNNKCSVKIVARPNLIYRPISLVNPFITDNRQKGENWVNARYDFTQTIHANTWEETTLYKIALTSKEVSAIKQSNKDNQSSLPYLGLCDKLDPSLYDSITSKICDALK